MNDETYIYHITSNVGFDKSKELTDKSLELEGFIHCAFKDQYTGVLERYFKGQDNLILIKISVSKLKSRLVIEDTTGSGKVYPHVYGPINADSILTITAI